MANYDKNKLSKRQKEAIDDIEGLLFLIDTYVIFKEPWVEKCVKLGEYVFNSSYNKENYEGTQSTQENKYGFI